ncbi:hydrolase [Salinisphaera sp. Q1T1-3]|uniref:hydrolase n=1 Tax=Salinisphaera sp. Q1T1-3 TaxID=2321229 RepID=UPI000E758466|nr:hydrolase [Salinisphaera sp. Q1T1-3]RJS91875.1 hydrolase [Salinisphaera sp. Q1T1-3]
MLTTSQFKPAFWLTNPHAQTLFASQARPMPALEVERERVELDDGDFLDLSWLPDPGLSDDAPIVVALHGLNGSLESKYARGLLRQCAAHGARGVLMHFRGAAEPNRLARSYHSGETSDFAGLVDRLRQRYPCAPLAAVGYSLGGNVLLKYLGEQGPASPLSCAVAVSVPYDLKRCAEAVQHGLSRIYQTHLLNGLREMVEAKTRLGLIDRPLPDLSELNDFPSFDNAITAPLNGFRDAADYYARSSSRGFLRNIRTPTLALHARDDPFMAPDVIPHADELADAVRLEVSERGGHVGFVAAGRLGQPVYWLEQRIPDYLRGRLPGFEPVADASEIGLAR